MRKFYYYTPILLQKIGYIIFYFVYRVFVRIEVVGREHIMHVTGPIIIATNHTSELDVTAIPLVLPFFSTFFPIYFVSNKTEKYKTFGWRSYIYGGVFFNMLGGYASHSGYTDYGIALTDHIELLRQGHTVCIFPEGKRTRDGNINPARGGLAYLVHATRAHVVPVAIDTFFHLSLWDFLTFQRKVVIRIGQPLSPEEIISINTPITDITVDEFRHGGEVVLEKIGEMLEM